jgi:hypothetical protein
MSAAEIAAWTGFGAMVISAIVPAATAYVMLRKLKNVEVKVEEVHVATNSLTDRLVATTKLEAHAAGLKEGRSERVEGS